MSSETETQEIWVPAGPLDELIFRPAFDKGWSARWEHHNNGWDKEYYQVYRWKGGWAVHRPAHPILGAFDGRTNTRQLAMEACAQDFEKVARLWRWTQHMITHEPPGESDA